MKKDSIYLKHVIDAISKIEDYVHDVSFENYQDNSMMQDAVIRQLLIVGEAVKLVSSELKENNNQIPWRDIAGMRDKLVHNYLGVDINAVWKTVKDDISPLKKQIKKLIK